MKRLALLVILLALTVPAHTQRAVSFASLTERQVLNGFRTDAVYLNDSGVAMGARFAHERSGFTLDLLSIQSVPQAFVWVTTFPTSDRGEPHTQEHLLLGKGNKGRLVASHEAMSLTTSGGFTMQWRTCYDFYTSAGGMAFYDEFEGRLDALVHPDYTDEEIRREVRNFGVTENPVSKQLGLEEKGTVYNEMVSSTDQPGRRIYSSALKMLYGSNHPLAFNSGGSPEALRVIQPSDIRRFHDAHYHLANMGALVSVPKDMAIESVLTRLDATLNRVQPQRPNRPVTTEKDLPAPNPAPAGQIQFVEYPHRNEQQPGSVFLVWPAERTLDVKAQTLFGLFLDTVAGDPTTNLYKRLIDSRTREADFGAQSVFGSYNDDQGFPVIVGFGNMPVDKMNERDLALLRTRVLNELNRIASWQNGSAELREFNDRLRSRVTTMRRDLSKFVNSPPGFGFRGNGSDWMTHLYLLNKESGFRKSVTMKSTLDAIAQEVTDTNNVWARYLPQWKLTAANPSNPANPPNPVNPVNPSNPVNRVNLVNPENPLPWILAAKPNPELARIDQQQREGRAAAELARLKQKYGTTADQEALRRYRTEYDANTADIDRTASRVAPARFIDHPPMTLDDQLDYKVTQLAARVPLVSSTFDSMTSATSGIALRLDGVPRDRLLYLSMLPQLLTRVGVVDNGRPVSYEEMSERMRKEILSLTADISTNAKTGRVELVVRGAGNDARESLKAVDWMRLVLFNADWRPENLPRIRDLVDQTLGSLRRTMQSAEENWVRGVATAYWKQGNPLLLSTSSFMTQVHNIHRLRWMLKDGTPEQRASTAAALNTLATLNTSRANLTTRLAELKNGADKLLAEAAKDLDLTLTDVPDSSLAADWSHLCREMASDLSIGPASTLATLNTVRQEILRGANARLFMVGSASTEQTLTPAIRTLVGALGSAPSAKANYGNVPLVTTRLRERDATATNPVFVGLLNQNSQSGVFLNTAPLAGWEDTDRQKLLDFLAAYLYGGGGGHSIFMKTIGAGLAYSNGLTVRFGDGRLSYYAERTPELPQTLRFVIGELQHAQPDPSLVDYAIAQAFGGIRSASPYELRGEQMAANLADGLTPQIVRRFHEGILALRSTPNLSAELYRRMNGVYARVLPGMGTKAETVQDGVYFVIGPEKQFTAWEEYLKSVEGPATAVYRLYPRDFWMN